MNVGKLLDCLDSLKKATLSSDENCGEYKEILVLKKMLEGAGIPFVIKELHGGYQISYPNDSDRVVSVVEHNFSYGESQDLLEIMGLLTEDELEEDSVAGYLTAQNVFDRISKHYKNCA